MKSSLEQAILLLLFQLLHLNSAIPTLSPFHEEQEVAIDDFHFPVQKRQYGNATGSVASSMLSPTALYWHVTALVNGQPLAVMIDTGTSDFWLQGPNAPSPDGSTPGAPMMDYNGQSAWFNITYQTQGDGSTFGPVVATEVKLGSLRVPSFGVGVATQVAFRNYPLDGFMGLGFKGLNTGAKRPIQESAAANRYKY
ncbi:MAG: hypothetical protein Q9170_005317 [Blastenia crenularia]